MSYLPSSDRRILENAIRNARDAAEAAARTALDGLEVNVEHPSLGHSEGDAALREALRALKAQLGGYEELVSACAYEQWHRMLFARFLAENGLLLHPDEICITLDECEELARGKGVDFWDLAAEYASGMLPGIFKPTDPLMKVVLAPEGRQSLEGILAGIPQPVFTSDDGLGWVYQYWQAKKKDEVNKSERKISGSDICAVTQLFTEPYMVQFLLQNTLGAWWLSLHSDSPLREKWAYYKEKVQHDFSAWPKTVGEVRIIDPCCGSGHFLVEALSMLLDMYQEESGVSGGDAAVSGIRNNLFGLEIDPRCTQIAAFAIALAAWKAGAPTGNLPVPNIACCGLPLGASKDEWKAIANGDTKLSQVLAGMHDLFANARDLGSLIDPSQLEIMKWHNMSLDDLREHLEAAFAKEKVASDPASAVFGEAARGAVRAFELLTGDYQLVLTNPPFLIRGRQAAPLQDHCQKHFAIAKKDLANCFVLRCSSLTAPGGTYALVTPQNWLFLGRDLPLRKHVLEKQRVFSVARLGARAFETITGEIVQVALIILGATTPKEESAIAFVDRPTGAQRQQKEWLRTAEPDILLQPAQMKNPDSRIANLVGSETALLEHYARGNAGIRSGDYPRFGRCFWELGSDPDGWIYQHSTVSSTCDFGGMEHMLLWENGKGQLYEYVQQQKANGYTSGVWKAGFQVWGQRGVLVSQVGSLSASLYLGNAFDNNTSAVVPHDPAYLPAVWCFCKSPGFGKAVRQIDQKLNVTNATLVKVPFDLDHWQQVAQEEYPNGLPEPHSDDPTQWLFKGDIASGDNPLQVAVGRLLDYRWPEQPEADGLDGLADADGILCLPALLGEQSAEVRLRNLLKAAYGSDWTLSLEESLLDQAGYKDKGLEAWLRDGFFEQHCKLFHHRPFIWHIWDGFRNGGFSALVNYHKLDRANLEKLTYTHLGEWIRVQNQAIADKEPSAEKRLTAAGELQKKLALILEGESPHDIYVRWKKLHEQPTGWEPDLNDGVRLNIRPFMTADVLRWRPNIKWGKDRGKDPDGSERINDLHLTIKEKIEARERAK